MHCRGSSMMDFCSRYFCFLAQSEFERQRSKWPNPWPGYGHEMMYSELTFRFLARLLTQIGWSLRSQISLHTRYHIIFGFLSPNMVVAFEAERRQLLYLRPEYPLFSPCMHTLRAAPNAHLYIIHSSRVPHPIGAANLQYTHASLRHNIVYTNIDSFCNHLGEGRTMVPFLPFKKKKTHYFSLHFTPSHGNCKHHTLHDRRQMTKNK